MQVEVICHACGAVRKLEAAERPQQITCDYCGTSVPVPAVPDGPDPAIGKTPSGIALAAALALVAGGLCGGTLCVALLSLRRDLPPRAPVGLDASYSLQIGVLGASVGGCLSALVALAFSIKVGPRKAVGPFATASCCLVTGACTGWLVSELFSFPRPPG